ncbi:MAG: histidinol-phosphate transaminase [Candidatus Electryonea clarkiae]|nr:histidinol-phosphate transaminase [Candidatus Electryonea clarkiae]MDP8285761.1 histidinol-phosphate transaminase [Candidatus Electryonea clarkiae]
MKLPAPPEHIERLKPYQPGRSIEEIQQELGIEKVIKLASNENPLGPSPLALKFIEDSLKSLSVYPNSGLTIRRKLSDKHNISINNVVAGSGSESILAAVMRAYLQPGDEILTAEGTFIGFYVLCAAQNLNCRTIPLKDYTFDLEAISEAISPVTRFIYLVNPNNPTGTAFSKSEFDQFIDRLPDNILVIMDEAYFEYAREWDQYPDSLEYRHDQVLTLRTFSKAYGIAGIRIGYGIGHEDIINNIMKVKLLFEPTTLSQAAGLGALEDDEFLQLALDTNRRGKELLTIELENHGFKIPPSVANFVFVPMGTPERAIWLSDELLQHGIIARPMLPFRLPEGVRITIGNDEEVSYLIEVLRKIMNK